MDEQRASELLGKLGPVAELPAMPDVAMRLVEMIEGGVASAGDMADVISRDPAMATRLLRVCNSALFASAGGATESVRDGIMRIGLSETRNILVTSAVMSVFPTCEQFELDPFWRHCVSSAIATGDMAEQSGSIAPREGGKKHSTAGSPYYLAGLLHDIGVLICSTTLAGAYTEVLRKNEVAREPLFVTEKDQLGFHHGEIGAALLLHWGLPEPVIQGAEWHHDPGCAPTEARSVAGIIHVTDWLLHHLGIGDGKDGVIERFDDQTWSDMKMDLGKFPEIIQAADQAGEAGKTLVELCKE